MKLRNLLNEMVEQACLEIGFPYDEGCTEYIETTVWLKHDINLNNEKFDDERTMDIFAEEVEIWKVNTERNF